MQIGDKRPFGAASDAESERAEKSVRREDANSPGAPQDPPLASDRPLLHSAGARLNARARWLRLLDPGPGRDKLPSAGALLLRLPHLRAGIARALPPGEQPGFLNTVVDSRVANTLGAAPRYDTLRALPAWDRGALLRDEAMARSILAEVMDDLPIPDSALDAAGLAHALPTHALQLQALEHVERALGQRRLDKLEPEDIGVLLAKLGRMCAGNAPGAERASAPNRLALRLLEQYLGHARGRDLREALVDAGALFHANREMAERVFALVQTHAGRLSDADRAQVLARTVDVLLQDPRNSPEPGMLALQDRVMAYLNAQVVTFSDPRHKASILMALAGLQYARPAVDDMFAGLLDAQAADLTARECGGLANRIAGCFLDRFAFVRAVQDRWAQRLDDLTGRADHASVRNVLGILIAHLTGDEDEFVDEDVLKPRFLEIIGGGLGRLNEDDKLLLLSELGKVMQWTEAELDWPEFMQTLHETVRRHLPMPSAASASDEAFSRTYPALVARMAGVLHELPDQGLAPAFDFMADRLAAMPAAWRVETLNQLATAGLESDTTRARSRQLLEEHVPQVMSLNVRALSEALLFSAHAAGFSARLQTTVADNLVRDLWAYSDAALHRTLGHLVRQLSVLAPGLDRQASDVVFTAVQRNVRRLPGEAADALMRELEDRILLMPAVHGTRALATVADHWLASGQPVSRNLGNTLIRFANALLLPAMPLQYKHEVIRTLFAGMHMLARVDPGEQIARVREALTSALDDPRLNSSLAGSARGLLDVVRQLRPQS